MVKYKVMEVEATIANIVVIDEFVAHELEQHGASHKTRQQIKLALEEVLANVASYAYPEGGGTMKVDLDFSGDTITLVISDSGVPFDPTNAPEPDISLSAEERNIGGLGVFLVQQIMDEMNYERVDGRNVLTLRKSIA